MDLVPASVAGFFILHEGAKKITPIVAILVFVS